MRAASAVLAALLAGAMRLPHASVMQREIDRHMGAVRRRYVGSARYALEVDADAYVRLWLQTLAGGAR